MSVKFLFAPIIGYLVAGTLKFIINTIQSHAPAYDKIGMGGMPSTHNTISSTTFFAIAFAEGFSSSIAALAFTVCILVAIDSIDLRRKVETHAVIISHELGSVNENAKNLRTKLGHRPIEVIAAWVLGAILGFLIALVN